MKPEPEQAVTVRACNTLSEFNDCVTMQREVWRFADLEIVSADLLLLTAKTGGQVFGAFDGQRMIGFAYAVPALREKFVYLHSHMLAVLPEYQNRGIGRLLKLAQREEALSRDIKLIEWTFDPLEIRNAYLNIARLGVVIRRYEPDLYGITSSPLHRGLPTDRLFAEWWLDSERVKAVLSGRGDACAKDRAISFATPTPETAREIQAKLRKEFQESFRQRLVVTGFERSEGKGTYWLSRG